MIGIVIGAAAGYVLGTKAGRERYEQIRKLSSKLTSNPSVQGAVGLVEGKVASVFRRKQKEIEEPAKPDMAYFADDTTAGPTVIT